MKVGYKTIEHGVTGYAPFKGAYLVGRKWDSKYTDEAKKKYKNTKTIYSTEQDIIAEIKSNPENEGVIFGGLEWSLQAHELIELIREAVKHDLKIMIYTTRTLGEFHTEIGKQGSYYVGYSKELDEATPDVFAMIGGMVLDAIINDKYWIRTGLEDVRVYTFVEGD